MTESPTARSILRRSNAYYRAGALDTERWAKVAELPDYDSAIESYDWGRVFGGLRRKDRATILDCGCGVGHFPRRLASRVPMPEHLRFDYDTVDVSPYSLTEHRRTLDLPFAARDSVNVAIEEFRPTTPARRYDLIWCMHSLYTVPRAALEAVMTTLTALLAPGGRGFVYLPKKRSAYMRIFDLHLAEPGAEDAEPYSTAEEVEAALDRPGASRVERVDCSFEHRIPETEPRTLETYLNQVLRALGAAERR